MMATIRRAVPDDVPQLAEVTTDAFDGMTLDEPYCRELIAKGDYMVWVAVMDNRVVGYTAAFVTTTTGAVRRWEVDLLAVHSDYRGSQLGTKLIVASSEAAEKHQVKFARALVRADNVAAHHAFQAAGYTNSETLNNLYIWEPQAGDSFASPSGKLIVFYPLDTLTYRGVWIEGLDLPFISEADKRLAVEHAQAMAAHDGRHNTGAVVAADKPLPDDLIQTSELLGQYQWWRKP